MVYSCTLVSVRSQVLDAPLKQGMVITGRLEIPCEPRETPSYLNGTLHNSSTTLTGDAIVWKGGQRSSSEKPALIFMFGAEAYSTYLLCTTFTEIKKVFH